MEIEQKIEEKNTDQKEEIVATEGYTLLCLMIGAQGKRFIQDEACPKDA